MALSIYALCNLNLPYPVPLLCGALVSAFAYSVRLRAGLCFPVVIIVYYIAFNISIDIITNIAFNILLKMYIAFNRQTWYNKTTMGGEAEKCRAPGDNITGGCYMPASKAQQKAVNKYIKENYDVFQIRMPKGKKDIIKAHAESRGESVNSFINRAVDETIKRDGEDK